jgi:S-methylmethionine-dependent homocysteine/selenocysteine methylase
MWGPARGGNLPMRDEIILLDGGMGTELSARGVEVPDHITSIWSAKALMDAPESVLQVHRDYIEAGADVITVNNYAVTRPILSRERLDDRFEELTLRAIDLARRARDDEARSVRIAGSMPPLETSYRPELVGEDDAILKEYRRMAEVLAPRVDILLCETMSSAREALAAATAATETDREVWVSWTLQGNRPDHLPSGETVREAYEMLVHLRISAYLVNCCGANFVTRAVKTLFRLTTRAVGGYANAADVIAGVEARSPPAPELVAREPLDVEGYATAVARWIEAGASIVGGCCSTRPAHIARLRRLLEELSS